jgi:hypothetical protein
MLKQMSFLEFQRDGKETGFNVRELVHAFEPILEEVCSTLISFAYFVYFIVPRPTGQECTACNKILLVVASYAKLANPSIHNYVIKTD